MRKMTGIKKWLLLPLLAALLGQSGCGGPIYANYREIEQLLVVQTVGFDAEDGGGVRMSVSSGAPMEEGASPVRMTAPASSLALAVQTIQDYSASKEIYYAHVRYFLLGEAAAADAGRYLDYVERSVQARLSAPLLVVRGGRAADAVMECGGDKTEVTEALSALDRDVQRTGGMRLFTCCETASALSRSGAALLQAVAAVPADPVTGGEGLAITPDGLAVLKDGALCGWIDSADSSGAALLMGDLPGGPVTLGSGVTLAITGGGVETVPVWSGEGALAELRFRVSAEAAVTELARDAELADSGETDALEAELSAEIGKWVRAVLETSRETGADFLELGRQIERSDPRRWDGVRGQWPALLGSVPMTAEISVRISRAYGLNGPVNERGDG